MSKIEKSALLQGYEKIAHGFLTRTFGERQAKGIESEQYCHLKQVHGTHKFEIKDISDIEKAKKTEGDILLTKKADIALTLVTADCVPLLFFDPIQAVVAAAHAGWRGTAGKVATKTIDALVSSYGSEAQHIRVAMGPSIRQCCYEVDAAVVKSFDDKAGVKPVAEKEGHWMLSLQDINKQQLIACGVKEEHIWISDICTVCHIDRFFSYRKEGKRAGRQWSYIALRR